MGTHKIHYPYPGWLVSYWLANSYRVEIHELSVFTCDMQSIFIANFTHYPGGPKGTQHHQNTSRGFSRHIKPVSNEKKMTGQEDGTYSVGVPSMGERRKTVNNTPV